MVIINVCGANGVGKTTTANIISYELGLLGNTTKVLHLADKVKELASQILDLIRDDGLPGVTSHFEA